MIFIVVALLPEAKPLITTLDLKILRDQTSFPIYQNEKYSLVVSGIGKVCSAIATTFLLTQYKNEDRNGSWIFNFGICGAPKEISQIGESFLIHKITDRGTGKSGYPDILFKSSLRESSLLTVDQPVFENESVELPNTLVDMEASGFFQASRKFFTSDKIRIVKTVSDHFTKFESITKGEITDTISMRIQNAIPEILQILSIPISPENEFELRPDEIVSLNHFKKTLRLSETETIQLKDWMIGFKIRTGKSPNEGKTFFETTRVSGPNTNPVKTREEGKKGLNALRQFYQS
ncbi:phosphorylase [Leptospira sp. WS92.C1]